MPNISLLIHDIRSTHNVGSLLRSAECFGVKEIYISGFTPYPRLANDQRLPHIADKNSRDIAKTALGAEKNLSIRLVDSLHDFLTKQGKNHDIVALEQDGRSIPLKDFTPKRDILLIIGREVEGVDPNILDVCDTILEIPMHGTKESLNVSVAAAIALYVLNS